MRCPRRAISCCAISDMAELPSRLRVPDEVIVRDLAGEALLVHLGTGTYFGLDATGTRIWHLLAEHGAREAVVARMLEEFDVPEAKLRSDMDALVAQLLERGLLAAAK